MSAWLALRRDVNVAMAQAPVRWRGTATKRTPLAGGGIAGIVIECPRMARQTLETEGRAGPDARGAGSGGVATSDAGASPGRWSRWMPLLVVAVGVAAYWNSFAGVFIFDDEHAIVRNRYIKHLWPLSEAMSAPEQSSVAGRPIVALSLAVNYALGGLKPWGFHLLNLVVHLLAGVALYGVVFETLKRRKGATGKGRDGDTRQSEPGRVGPVQGEASRKRRQLAGASDDVLADGGDVTSAEQGVGATRAAAVAGICAMIWLVHPLQTESVTYIVQRAEAIMGMFYLGSLYCAIRGFTGVEDSSAAWRRRAWLAASVVLCGLGMASKEVMATAPIMIALYDRVFVSPSWRAALARRWWYYLALVGTWLILLSIVIEGPRSDSAGFNLADITPLSYMLMQINAVLVYLKLSFWPAELCLDHWAFPESPYDLPQGKAVLLAVILFLTVWVLIRWPRMGYWLAWVFVILAPTSSFIPIADPVFEHRMYVPLAGLIVAVVLAADALLRRATRGAGSPAAVRRRGAVAGGLLATAIIGALTARTIARNADYHDALTMWELVVRQKPHNPRALANLSFVYLERGQAAAAQAACDRAIEIAPHFHDSYQLLAQSLMDRGQIEEAISMLRRGLDIKPNDCRMQTNLGEALTRVGRNEDAVAAFQRAIKSCPREPLPYFNLGRTLQEMGRPAECIEPYRAFLEMEPDNTDARVNLATALALLGKLAEAEVEFAELLRRQPGFAPAYYGRGLARAKAGRVEEAMADYREAIARDPSHADARCNLAILLKQTGRRDEAEATFREAIRISPLHLLAYYNLGTTLVEQRRLDEAATAFETALAIQPDHEPSRRALAATRAMQRGETGGAPRGGG